MLTLRDHRSRLSQLPPARLPVALLALALSLSCAGGDPGGEALFDGSLTPDVLVESRALEMPPSTAGNRYLSAWWPADWGEGLHLIPQQDGARLEVVHLEHRPRTLVVSNVIRQGPPDATTRVVVAGRDLGELPLAPRLEVPLPPDLPLGRVPVDLVTGDALVAVANAGVTPSLPAGSAAVEGGDLAQSGSSLVDLVRPVEPTTQLRGLFDPPSDPRPEQSWELWIEAEGRAPERVFEWSPGALAFLRSKRIAATVEARGPVRFRFVARGAGPAGHWRGLRLAPGAGAAGTAGAAAPDAARDATDWPGALPDDAPRLVMVYIPDALRADSVGHLGSDAGVTPTIDRLATEGAAFHRHFSVAPNTMPSTKTLFTGMVFLTRGGWNLPADGPTTLAERFRSAGWRTGLFTGNGNITADRGLARGFETAPRRILFGSYASEELPYNDNAERVHRAALDWIDSLGPQERAFVHIQTIHPHNPYDPPEPFRSRYTGGIPSTIDGSTETLLDIKHNRRDIDPADERRLAGLYAGGMAYNDAELDRFLEQLAQRYEPGEVLIIVTSDHGEELFEHGGVLHGYTLYDEQLWIPLVFWWPGRIAPQRIDAGTDNVDLHATLASLADGAAFEPGAGRPLWPLLGGAAWPDRPVQFAAASSLEGGTFMARGPRYKVVWTPRKGTQWGMGQGRGRGRSVEYVFDLVEDPGEQVNLAGEDILEAAWLRSLLYSWVELGKRLEVGEEVEAMDEETIKSLRALGYVQ